MLHYGLYQCDLGMCFQGSEIAGGHTALTLKFRSSEQAWRSHVLDAKQFLQDRGLKTHSGLMPFLPRRKIAFSIFCVLRVTDCLETLVWRSFFKASSPEAVTVGTLTGKVKASSKGLFHHVFSIGEISEPRSIWSYLASYGYTPGV